MPCCIQTSLCIVIVFFLDDDVINFEINQTVFPHEQEIQDKSLNILRRKFLDKMKSIFQNS